MVYKDGFPTVEQNCILGAGAKLFGRIICGECSIIGANAVVTNGIVPYSLLKLASPKVIKIKK